MPSCINEVVSLLGYNWIVKLINFIHLAILKESSCFYQKHITKNLASTTRLLFVLIILDNSREKIVILKSAYTVSHF